MTTVVACRKEGIMVADSKCIEGELKFKTPKVRGRANKFLVGAAGDSTATELFFKSYPRIAVREQFEVEGEEIEFTGLALTPEGIMFYDVRYNALVVDEDYYAIGTGAMAAMAVITAALKKGRVPNPVFAVEVACDVDVNSGGPVVVYELKGRKKKNATA